MENELTEGTVVELQDPPSHVVELLEHRGENPKGEFLVVKIFKFAGWLILTPVRSTNEFFVKMSAVKKGSNP